jgi:putative flavoprotein involved in K+ transport
MRSTPAHVDVAIIGAGQAGLSLSGCLRQQNIAHIVLEKGRTAESWRSRRWDSFCLVTPNWTVQLPGQPYNGNAPEGFMGRDLLVSYLDTYSKRCGEILAGCEVTQALRQHGQWQLRYGDTHLRAQHLVIATGTYDTPVFPPHAEATGAAYNLHSAAYKSPQALPDGAVLVVGSGQSGAQIAAELNASGREVYLATSRVADVPRQYRGRDIISWQYDLGWLDRHVSELDDPSHRFNRDPILSGRSGFENISLRTLAAAGVQLLGRLSEVHGDELRFDSSLTQHMQYADTFRARVTDAIDELIRRRGLHAPLAEGDYPTAFVQTNNVPASRGQAGTSQGEPGRCKPRPRKLSLGADGIQNIIWATGYTRSLGWLDAPDVFDDHGQPQQNNWQTAAPNLHFLGFNYVEHRRSGILYGAAREATDLAGHLTRALGHNP